MRRIVVLVISAITLLASGTALAQNAASESSRRARHWDGYMFMPYTFGQTIGFAGGSNLKLDDDLGWGMGFSYNVDERINIGSDFGWSSLDYTAHVEADAGAPGGLDIDYGNQADIGAALMALTVNVLPRRLTPYANGAVGWVWVNTNIAAGYSQGCYWDPWYGYICGAYPVTYGDDGVGYRVGAGLRWDAGRAFFLKVGYNHSWIDMGGEAPGFDQIRLDFGGIF